MIIAVKLHEITTSCKYVLFFNKQLVRNGNVFFEMRGLKNKRTYSEVAK